MYSRTWSVREVRYWSGAAITLALALFAGPFAESHYTRWNDRTKARRETVLFLASDVVDRNHNQLLEPEEKLDAFKRLGYDTRRFDIMDIPDISILDTNQLERLVTHYEDDGIYPNYGSW